jgi:hypothetical protein
LKCLASTQGVFFFINFHSFIIWCIFMWDVEVKKTSSFFYLLMVNGFCYIDNRSLMSYSLSQTPPDSKSGNCFFQPPEVFECGRGLDIGPSVAPKKGCI